MSAETFVQHARDQMYMANKAQLEHMAYRTIQAGCPSHEFVGLIIDGRDPTWAELVSIVSPDIDWQRRDRTKPAVITDVAEIEAIGVYLSESLPDVAREIFTITPLGTTKAVVLSNSGASVYLLEPKQHYQD